MTSTVGGFVLKGILLDGSSRESCLDLRLRMMKHTRTCTQMKIINANDSAAADAIMLPSVVSRSDIVGVAIVVPFEGLVVAIAVGRFVVEFVAIVEFFIWVCVDKERLMKCCLQLYCDQILLE